MRADGFWILYRLNTGFRFELGGGGNSVISVARSLTVNGFSETNSPCNIGVYRRRSVSSLDSWLVLVETSHGPHVGQVF